MGSERGLKSNSSVGLEPNFLETQEHQKVKSCEHPAWLEVGVGLGLGKGPGSDGSPRLSLPGPRLCAFSSAFLTPFAGGGTWKVVSLETPRIILVTEAGGAKWLRFTSALAAGAGTAGRSHAGFSCGPRQLLRENPLSL